MPRFSVDDDDSEDMDDLDNLSDVDFNEEEIDEDMGGEF